MTITPLTQTVHQHNKLNCLRGIVFSGRAKQTYHRTADKLFGKAERENISAVFFTIWAIQITGRGEAEGEFHSPKNFLENVRI